VHEEAIRLIGKNGADVANKHGRYYVAVTYPTDKGVAPGVQKLINRFTGNDDLADAIRSSTYIPMWSGPRMTIK
jgi:hypothetical protein